MAADRIEPKPWIRSPWFTWSWMIVLAVVVIQSLTYHWRLLPTTASGYFTRGRADYYEGEYEHAIENLTKAIADDGSDVESYLWRGEAYAKVHDFEKSKADVTKALALSPDYAKAHAAHADYLAAIWDTDGAIKEFTVAIDRDPTYGRCFLMRGQLYFDAGRWDDAAADLRKAGTLLDDDMRGESYVLLWLARARGGDVPGATAELAKVAEAQRVSVGWFAAAVEFLGGDMTEPAFIAGMAAGAATEDEETTKAGDVERLKTEAYFVAGEKMLVLSDRPGALGLLREVIRSDVEDSYAYDRARVEIARSFVGFETTRQDDGSLKIVSSIPGGPADAAGIRPGSTLATIDGEPANRDTFLEFLAKLTPESTVELQIVGADGAERKVPLTIPLTPGTSAPTK